MTQQQQDEYVRAVDEMRRQQIVLRRPPTPIDAKLLALAEAHVDMLTAKYREHDPVPSSTTVDPVPNPNTPTAGPR